MRFMTRPLLNRSRRLGVAVALLVALSYQAMIPTGYMPAANGSFALQICHSGLPAPSDPHDNNRHSGGHSHVEFCPFGALPGAAPISHVAAVLPAWTMVSQAIAEPSLTRPHARAERAHPPRGPPSRSDS
jgi:hypothetical protein